VAMPGVRRLQQRFVVDAGLAMVHAVASPEP
jgi:hypothetical protein